MDGNSSSRRQVSKGSCGIVVNASNYLQDSTLLSFQSLWKINAVPVNTHLLSGALVRSVAKNTYVGPLKRVK
jgi:hypothetical protein